MPGVEMLRAPRELTDLPLLGGPAELRRDRLGLLTRAAELGPLVLLDLGRTQAVVASTAEALQAALVENADAFRKTERYQGATRLLGSGLPQLEGQAHKSRRKLLAPAFGHARIAGWARVMIDQALRAQARWSDGARIDLCDEIRELNLGIVAETLLGTDLRSEARELDAELKVVDDFVTRQLATPVQLPSWLPTPAQQRARAAIARIDRSIGRAVAGSRSASAEREDLLAMLAGARDEAGEPLDDRQLRDEALALLIACQDTTPNALAWSFELLIRHPETYAALRREADASAGVEPALLEPSRMRFALQIFRESLRLYPPVYVTARQAVREVEICGVRVPEGTLLWANVYGLHRQRAVFDDPARFNPQRWDGDFERKLPRGSFLPFIDGPRVCIGNQFALLEGQLVLTLLVRHVIFEPARAEPSAPDPLVTLRPRGGVPVIVRRR